MQGQFSLEGYRHPKNATLAASFIWIIELQAVNIMSCQYYTSLFY